MIGDIDINNIVVSNKSKIFDISLATGDKKIRTLCMFFPKVRVYRIEFYETGCMCFMIKDEIVFDIYMETWEKVNIIKKN